jgi:hypothetical protein
MSKCKCCGGETFFIRHIEGGDYFRIVCTECDTLCGHLTASNIPTIELTPDEIDDDQQYFDDDDE